MKKILRFLLLAVIGFALPLHAEEATFRPAFTLKLHVDSEHYYSQDFPKIPYVHQGIIYLFAGDRFGVNLSGGPGPQSLSYATDVDKADLIVDFKQNVGKDGTAIMMLELKNNTPNKLELDAGMTTPGTEGMRKTSIIPIEPGLVNFESWPHPIIQLVLMKLRVAK